MNFCYISWYPYIIESWLSFKIILPSISIIKWCPWVIPWSCMISSWTNSNPMSSWCWNLESYSYKSFYNICSSPTRPWSSEAYIVVLLFSSKVFVFQYMLPNFRAPSTPTSLITTPWTCTFTVAPGSPLPWYPIMWWVNIVNTWWWHLW